MNSISMLINFTKGVVLAALFITVTGCSNVSRDTKDNRSLTLADLPEAPLDEAELNPVPRVSLNELEEIYTNTLVVVKDENLRHKLQLRLADLAMARSEQEQIVGEEGRSEYFADAITLYEEMLAKNEARQGLPDTPSNERLLYRLSKAYALDGRLDESNIILDRLVSEFPESPYRAEADFRRAELAFSYQKYEQAEALYAQVIDVGMGTPFYKNALYMHGWARFKQSRYKAAIPSFTEVLDLTLIEDNEIAELPNSRRHLAEDTLRIISILFSYLDGAETITNVYENLGERHYQHLLYQTLAEFYLEQDRYKDSADTYVNYVKHNPNSEYSPIFSVKAISVYEQGDYPSLILPAKEEFVKNYGIYSSFWQAQNDIYREQLKPKLNQYIDELASYHHATAYDLQKENQAYQAFLAKKKKGKVSKKEKRRFKKKPEDPTASFKRAALLYKEFMETFPDDKKTPELVYLMGEAYFEAKMLTEAVKAYEIVAYRYLDDKRGAEAGYSALISMRRLIKLNEGDKKDFWRNHKVDSAINYADFYADDKRSVGVLTAAAQELFEGGQFERSANQARRVTLWQPQPPKKLLMTAWLVLSHSYYDLEKYAQAEVAYRQFLPMLEINDPRRVEIIERIAASMFKQAEQLAELGEKEKAANRLLAIRDIAPRSDIAINAQYDAANYLIELKHWPRAEEELLDFQKQFPQHKLISTLPPKFAFIYQESEQWHKAAKILAGIAESAADPEVRRQSLYLSAERYEKASDVDAAINQYRSYAHAYAKPFGIATEARYKLVQLYEQTKQDAKRSFWLKKLVEAHDGAGSAKTARSAYLAASASLEFANEDFYRFKNVQLGWPIKKSLKEKRKAMSKALKGYKKVIGYGVAEFATEANNRIGNVYARLSEDLMDSDRPAGLDALALEQYEILLEEQAIPFEDKAIEIHAKNAARSWTGLYDKWVKQSFKDLARLLPVRYGKKEEIVEFSDALY